MTQRAEKIFNVRYDDRKGLRLNLRVRLLPTIAAVHREYEKGGRPEDCVPLDGTQPLANAYYLHSVRKNAQHSGMLVLSADGDLHDLIPHEVTHAVVRQLRVVHDGDDEQAATAIGIISSRIYRQVRKHLNATR